MKIKKFVNPERVWSLAGPATTTVLKMQRYVIQQKKKTCQKGDRSSTKRKAEVLGAAHPRSGERGQWPLLFSISS